MVNTQSCLRQISKRIRSRAIYENIELVKMHVLQLEVVGPGGPPDGHGDEDDEHHHY